VFFVVFIIVGSFFIMNLFVGVTIDKFNEMKEESAAEYEAELNRMRGKIGFTSTGALQHGKAYQQKGRGARVRRGGTRVHGTCLRNASKCGVPGNPPRPSRRSARCS
jgi:hypothetical protein